MNKTMFLLRPEVHFQAPRNKFEDRILFTFSGENN